MNELLAEEFVSQQARDDAVAELKLAEAEQRSAEENVELARLEHRQSVDQLNRRVLRSPFNGVVVDQYLFPGRAGRRGRRQEADPQDRRDAAADRAGDPAVPVLPRDQGRRHRDGRSGEAVHARDRRPHSHRRSGHRRAAGTFGVIAEIPNAGRDLPGGIRCKLKLPNLDAKAR
jgi:hypothetical protein